MLARFVLKWEKFEIWFEMIFLKIEWAILRTTAPMFILY